MQPPSPEVRRELAQLLQADQTRVGQVYRLTQKGLTRDEIAAELGVKTSGFVSNCRGYAETLLGERLPGGPSIAKATGQRIRRLTQHSSLSPEASRYVRGLLAEVAAIEHQRSRSSDDPELELVQPQSLSTLRAQVEAALRSRAEQLVVTIRSETRIDADDYYRLVAGTSPVDELARLCEVQETSRTTKKLHDRRRLDLSIEAAVVEWSQDLPLTAGLTEAARSRLAYWRSDVTNH